MMPFKLELRRGYFISEIAPADKPTYLEHLKEKQIQDQTLAIPYPYTEADADWWIDSVAAQAKKQGRALNWALRRPDGLLIGGIGFHDLELGKSHKAELGYWLAKPYWNQGIMTEAVRAVCELAFRELGLVRVSASVFDFNGGSMKVLEKAGFQREGRLLKYYKKDGRVFDGLLYAKLAPAA